MSWSTIAPNVEDTIAAIASGRGSGCRGIIRLSGPQVAEVARQVFEPRSAAKAGDWWHVRGATRGRLLLTALRAALPCTLLLWPGHRSYTRQPLVEFHTLAAWPLLEAALTAMCHAGARLAHPGEFTLRGFLAGRLDLTQAEAVMGVVQADSRHDLQVALRQLAGGLGHSLGQIRTDLLDLLAEVEAGLDFPDEDLQFISPDALRQRLDMAYDSLSELTVRLQSRSTNRGERRIVLWGAPNVGKSSLFNALLGAQAAVVHELAGTTRDAVSVPWHLAGIPCELVDTAGRSRDEATGIDAAAQACAVDVWRQADVPVLCLDGSRAVSYIEQPWLATARDRQELIVTTKSDLSPHPDLADVALRCSAHRGDGISAVRNAIADRLASVSPADVVAASRVRCEAAIQGAREALGVARDLSRTASGHEWIASELRIALHHLGQVIGAVYTDDVLERIFSRFCIGK